MTVSEKAFAILVALLVSGVSVSRVQAEDKLYVRTPAAYSPHGNYVTRVKDECAVEVKLAEHVRKRLDKDFDQVISVKELTEAGDERVLTLTILKIYGADGAGWAGTNRIAAEATLLQAGRVLGVFRNKNSSKSAFAGATTEPCAQIDIAARNFADSVATWLTVITPGKPVNYWPQLDKK